MAISPVGFCSFASWSKPLVKASRKTFTSKPTCISKGRMAPPCWSNNADIRCSGSIDEWSWPIANDWASDKANCNWLVKRSIRIVPNPHSQYGESVYQQHTTDTHSHALYNVADCGNFKLLLVKNVCASYRLSGF